MNPLKKNWNPSFSHIYVEKEAVYYPLCQKILQHFKNSRVIPVQNYQDVFMKKGQDFVVQKNSPKLILAVKHSSFLYKGSAMCNSYGHEHFYYLSNALNCLYHCDYCYLQGMHPSANLVVFVNIMDALEEVKSKPPMFLSLSYDTDLLALESWTGILKHWIQLDTPSTLEIRTKSASFHAIQPYGAKNNLILSWTVSPETIIQNYEHKTPPLSARLENIQAAISQGWRVRLCIDPVLWVDHWQSLYQQLTETLFTAINPNSLEDVSTGVFRCTKGYFKKMKKVNDAAILADPVLIDGHYSYPADIAKEMEDFMKARLSRYLPGEKILFWS